MHRLVVASLVWSVLLTGCVLERAGLDTGGPDGSGGSAGLGGFGGSRDGGGGLGGRAFDECSTEQDCPSAETGPWSTCEFVNECDLLGTRQRTVTVFECIEGECVPSQVVETGECSRETDGVACGAKRQCGAFGACVFDPSDVCDQDGVQSAPCQRFSCVEGVCKAFPDGTETRACSRKTDQVVCDQLLLCDACNTCSPKPCYVYCQHHYYACDAGNCVHYGFNDSKAQCL